ncbi:hypothetical protein GCM10027589_27770 [Actinocorallia lasiicapitis]
MLFAVPLLAGCSGDGTPDEPPRAATAESVVGIWSGSYDCDGARENVRLTLSLGVDLGVEGTAEIAPIATPGVYVGSFPVSGVFDGGALLLHGDTIGADLPDELDAVDLNADGIEGDKITGKVRRAQADCGAFAVTRQD